MEANRESNVGDEELTRRLHIVYFLSREGKVEQPHLITVPHLNNNDVFLRDFKRWLSEFRGREMPEWFTWSYKRKYKTGYIWQDLTEDDPIIPASSYEYVLKGSLILSPIKIKEEQKEEKETEPLASSAVLKSPNLTFQIDKKSSPNPPSEVSEESSSIEELASTSSSSSKTATRRTAVFKIDYSREEMKRENKQRCKENILMRNERQLKGVKSKEPNDRGARKWASILKKIMACAVIETKNSVRRAVSNQSCKRYTVGNNNEEKLQDNKNIKGKGRMKK